MLRVTDLSFDYNDREIFSNVSFSLTPGEMLHIRGSNGSGKTTLLKIIAKLLPFENGEIIYNNQLMLQNNFINNVCFVGHKPGISLNLTPRELYECEFLENNRAVSFEEIINQLKLTALEDIPCIKFSAGQIRKVALMRLFVSSANLWLLDEPLTALDNDTIHLLITLFKQHLLNNGQIILTSHQKIPLENIPSQEYWLT